MHRSSLPFGFGGIGFAALAALTSWACSGAPGQSESVDQTGQALTAGVDACLLGSQQLRIGDRSQVQGLTAAGGLFDLGTDTLANAGDVRVAGNAVLHDRAKVQGNLTASGTITRSPNATITGTATANAQVTIPALRTQTVTPGTTNVEVPARTTRALAAGSYGDVVVRSGASISVSGTYNVRSLLVEPGASITEATPGSGAQINVAGNVTFGDRSTVSVADPLRSTISIYSNGNILIGGTARLTAILSAPTGDVHVGSGSFINGCVGGRVLTLDPVTQVIASNVNATLPTVQPAAAR